jgi:hypothetical protein
VLLPGERVVKIRGVQVHGAAQIEAEAGQRVALNLAGIDVGDLTRGQVLTSRGAVRAGRVIDAASRCCRARGRSRMACACGFTRAPRSCWDASPSCPLARRRRLGRPAGLRAASPRAAGRPDAGRSFRLAHLFAACDDRGRVVLDPQGRRGGVRTAAAAAWFARLEPQDSPHPDDRAIAAMVEERGTAGSPAQTSSRVRGLRSAARRATVQRLARAGAVDDLGAVLVAPALRARWPRRWMRSCAPITRPIRSRTACHVKRCGSGSSVGQRRCCSSASSTTSPSGAWSPGANGSRAARTGWRSRRPRPGCATSSSASCGPPVGAARRRNARGALHAAPDLVERVLALLVRQKTVVKVGPLHVHAEALEALKAGMRQLKATAADARVDVAPSRSATGSAGSTPFRCSSTSTASA